MREPQVALAPPAEIVCVGTELVSGTRVDTNSVWLRQRLRRQQLRLNRVIAVPDTLPEMQEAIGGALARAALVVVTGGLGPTDDDRTLEAVERVTGRTLKRDRTLCRRLEERARLAGRQPTESQLRMARVPDGALVLANPCGAAPGLWLEEVDDRLLVLLPGVPDEVTGIFTDGLEERLRQRFGASQVERRVVRLGGLRESEVDGPATEMCRHAAVELTTLASSGTVELHLEGAADRVATAVNALVEHFGSHVVSRDGASLEEVVLDAAAAQGGTVATAESCTGGRLAARLTAIPGASRVFGHGLVTYSDAAKTDLLGVPATVLAQHGAVSEATVRAMAEGARQLAEARWSVAITGIAGPDGGSADKPVGTVWLATAAPHGVRALRLLLPGSRTRIQKLAAGVGLDLLRRAIQADGKP